MEEDLEKEKQQREALRKADPNMPMPYHPPPLVYGETKFTEDRRRSILGALVGNHFPSTAASLAGIDVRTLNAWLRQGRIDLDAEVESEYADFLVKYEQAMAVGEQKALTTVNKASDRGDVRAATWILERRHGKGKWEKTDRLEVGGSDGQPIVVELKWPGQRDEGLPPAPSSAAALPSGDDDVVDGEIVEPGHSASG